MPVAKSRTKQVSLVQKVADMLEIPEERIYLMDALHVAVMVDSFKEASAEDSEKPVPTGKGRLHLRVWTGGMVDGERERLASLKDAVKELASRTGTKIAMSDKHPEEQAAYELRRRRSRGKAFKLRKKGLQLAPNFGKGQ